MSSLPSDWTTSLKKFAFEGYKHSHPWSTGQVYAMMAITIAGIVSFLGIYTAATGIDKNELDAENADQTFKKQRNTQFIVMLVLAIIAIVFGWIAARLLKNSIWVYIPMGIIFTGILGFSYAIGLKLRSNSKAKIALSVLLFVIVAISVLVYGIKAKKNDLGSLPQLNI